MIVTDIGLDWYVDTGISKDENIDTVALGTGTSSESVNDTSLDNEEYRSDVSNDNVDISQINNNTYEAYIEVVGGREISAGTEITEFGLFAEGNTANEVLVARGNFSAVELSPGIGERFRAEVSITR